MAGTGKSTVACTVAKLLNERASEGRASLGASFFCARQQEDLQNPLLILPTLVYQIARNSRLFGDALEEVERDLFYKPVDLQVQGIFVKPWISCSRSRSKDLPPMVVVIDALDENLGARALVKTLMAVLGQTGKLAGLKFFIISRPDPELTKHYDHFHPKVVCHLHEIESAVVYEDILRYVAHTLPGIAEEPILEDLARSANGLFIYAATAVRLVQTAAPSQQKTELEDLLHSWPSRENTAHLTSSLDDVYVQVLTSAFSCMPNQRRGTGLLILHTIICMQTRVTTQVIADLLGSIRPVDKDAVQKIVQSLHGVLYTHADGTIYWYHSSFFDFLHNVDRATLTLDPARSTQQVLQTTLNASSQHGLLAEACFRHMNDKLHFNMCKLSSSFDFDKDIADLQSRREAHVPPSLQYANQYWAIHLRNAADHQRSLQDGSPVEDLSQLLLHFLEQRVLFWIEVMNLFLLSEECISMLLTAKQWALTVRKKFWASNYLNTDFPLLLGIDEHRYTRLSPVCCELCPSFFERPCDYVDSTPLSLCPPNVRRCVMDFAHLASKISANSSVYSAVRCVQSRPLHQRIHLRCHRPL